MKLFALLKPQRRDAVAAPIPRSPWWEPGDRAPTAPPEPVDLTDDEHLICLRLGKRAVEGDFAVPSIPLVAAETLALLNRAEPDPKQVAKHIARDQQIAADVISFANSALFAGVMEVTNIPQAVARVGFARTRNLVLASSLRGLIFSGANRQRAEDLWHHSIACAGVASIIARNLREHPDDGYLAGLFHDVGKSIVLSLLEAATRKSEPCRPEFIDHVVELYHEGVGVLVTTEWKLPQHVVNAIRKHTERDGVRLTKAQAITALADNVCHRLHLGAKDDGRPIARATTLEVLGASPADLGQVLDGIRGVIVPA
jgi:putative nucleotidyltransferase with HDIG domain